MPHSYAWVSACKALQSVGKKAEETRVCSLVEQEPGQSRGWLLCAGCCSLTGEKPDDFINNHKPHEPDEARCAAVQRNWACPAWGVSCLPGARAWWGSSSCRKGLGQAQSFP